MSHSTLCDRETSPIPFEHYGKVAAALNDGEYVVMQPQQHGIPIANNRLNPYVRNALLMLGLSYPMLKLGQHMINNVANKFTKPVTSNETIVMTNPKRY